MYGEAYLRKGLIPHVATALEEYLWLASQVPDALLTQAPAGGGPPVREQVLDLALDLDLRVYPALLAQLDARDAAPVLDPDTVAARVAELQDYGYDEVIGWMNFGNVPPEETLASMRLFAERVRPQLDLATAAG